MIHTLLKLLINPLSLHMDESRGGESPQEGLPSAGGGNIRDYIDDSGGLKPGWSKALGAPESFEKKFTSLNSAFGSHANLESMLGRDKVPMPGEGSPKEEWDSLYQKLGRPEKPQDYGLTEQPEGLDEALWDRQRAENFQHIAHELGLSQKQAKALVDWELKNVGSQMQAMQENQEITKARAGESLRQEWGGLYDNNMSLAYEAARMAGGQELLKDPYLANHPTFIKAMSSIGRMLCEGNGAAGIRETRANFGGHPRQEIDKIMSDKSDPYWNPQHPQNAARIAYMESLYARAYPEGR